ncbi:MAG: 3-phosphoshikimate 1-carboxyvinyltransferase [Treponema sp.]|jgi:3-phosphoshikimate 1-carboxyvinyltransferase|nr:3-phosphoshikimate 1-carboxyvinyltransferase [Treponema sp.]
MHVLIKPHILNGTIAVPGSKSHTIRRLLFAALTNGVSYIVQPLDSLDTQSCVAACRIFGAKITEDTKNGINRWIVRGNAFPFQGGVVDVGNSGTTLFFSIAAAALFNKPVAFTGDDQTARRSAGPLLSALTGLEVKVISENDHIPITICGPWKGGKVSLSCPTSQYLSALLIAAPLASANTVTEIEVPFLNEKPYVEMTLAYLKAQGFYDTVKAPDSGFLPAVTAVSDFSRFCIRGGCVYAPINGPVPGDFSSAAFPAAAAAISGGTVTLLGLDPGDSQGDKVFFEYLARMGCVIQWKHRDGTEFDGAAADWQLTVSRTGTLQGGTFDLNNTPDLLPVMAVLGAYAEGETALVNAAHARIKETDRIAVMAVELRKLFSGGKDRFRCEEKPDGLLIRGSAAGSIEDGKSSITLDGHGDHRIVMALVCAALGLPAGTVLIHGAEAAKLSYPGFLELLGA